MQDYLKKINDEFEKRQDLKIVALFYFYIELISAISIIAILKYTSSEPPVNPYTTADSLSAKTAEVPVIPYEK